MVARRYLDTRRAMIVSSTLIADILPIRFNREDVYLFIHAEEIGRPACREVSYGPSFH